MKNKKDEYTRIFWMASELWETSMQFPDNVNPKLDPTENRIYEAAILFYFATKELHMSHAERYAEKTEKEMMKLIKKGFVFD